MVSKRTVILLALICMALGIAIGGPVISFHYLGPTNVWAVVAVFCVAVAAVVATVIFAVMMSSSFKPH